MKRAYLVVLVIAVFCGLVVTMNLWKLKAQETQILPGEKPREEFALNLEDEMDLELAKVMDLLEDAELLEMLISDSDFLDVLEEFEEDIGIGEEEIPYDLLEQSELFKQTSMIEAPTVKVCSLRIKEGGAR